MNLKGKNFLTLKDFGKVEGTQRVALLFERCTAG